jgi:two-component system phosphate regulon response regulator PhoB
MGARIMIVEDEEPLALLLRYNLEAEGYEVETIARGDDADTRLREGAADLAVLDWMLPGLSGIELCRRLRARPETKALPIIMLTARGEESERVRGLATGSGADRACARAVAPCFAGASRRCAEPRRHRA